VIVAEKPLSGWRILITRPADQIPIFAAALEAVGAVAVAYPTIAVQPPPSWEPLDQALARARAGAYQWVIFSSPSAVRFTLARAAERAGEAATGTAGVFGLGVKIAAVGAQTARALTEAGLTVDLFPEADQRQEGLIDALAGLPAGTSILFPQALGGREQLGNHLTHQGCLVDVVPVSQTVPVPLPAAPPPFDVATFASPSAFRAFVDGHGITPLTDRLILAIGPTTAATITAAGVRVDLIPAIPSGAAVIDALVRYRRAGSTSL
jgi:uroporphyrinogen-III synthase